MDLGKNGRISQNAPVELPDGGLSSVYLNENSPVGVLDDARETGGESTPIDEGPETDTLYDPLKPDDCTYYTVHLGKPLNNPIQELLKATSRHG